ncbi:MAG: hypothetical protein KDI71_18240 [Xanthomonadales bacterium]|nr:hypothetical protein [Xanthomonadales bacterium]
MNQQQETGFKGPGGTGGGLGEFVIGFVMAIAGFWLLTNQVQVTTGGWRLWGYNAFGLSLLPFIIGVGVLFFNGRSILGWLLTLAGLVIVFAGILVNMSIYFRPTSLFNTLLILILITGGIGLLVRSLSEHGKSSEGN